MSTNRGKACLMLHSALGLVSLLGGEGSRNPKVLDCLPADRERELGLDHRETD